jgi:phosphoglycolate phosphatase-like HAD superfamily hydrolase
MNTKLKVVVFDFDGVIVESNAIKNQAFKNIFSQYPDTEAEMMAYHLKNPGKTRTEKFEYILDNLMPKTGQQRAQLLKQWSMAFIEHTEDLVATCSYVFGAVRFLDELHGKLPLYLASATPTEPLLRVIQRRKMEHYFKKIFGGPIDKKEVLKEIIRIESVESKQVLFIGDSQSDWLAAQEAKVRFIGRKSDEPSLDFKQNYDIKNNLQEIYEQLVKENAFELSR